MKSSQCRTLLFLVGLQSFFMALLLLIVRFVHQYMINISLFEHIINSPVSMTSLLIILSFLMIMTAKAIPQRVTRKEIMNFAKELQEQMEKLKQDNENLHKQIEGTTSYDEAFAKIINTAIDYLKHSPAAEIVPVRSFLLYSYTGNSQEIKNAVRTLSPGSEKIQNINIYGGQNQILPTALSAQQN